MRLVGDVYKGQHVYHLAARDMYFLQAEVGIRDLVRSRGLGDVYKRQMSRGAGRIGGRLAGWGLQRSADIRRGLSLVTRCLLYTSDAADERSRVDLGGRRIIQQKIPLSQLCSN